MTLSSEFCTYYVPWYGNLETKTAFSYFFHTNMSKSWVAPNHNIQQKPTKRRPLQVFKITPARISLVVGSPEMIKF